MVYVKSILVALLALVTAAFVTLVALVIVVTARVPRAPGTAIGVDPESIARSFPVVWLVPALVFIGSFAWEYRRLQRKKSARQV
ncbi:MAG TPA: hypothetical protein VL523_13920 [Terriglobia bacterium]|nr:hypothetical protein [Terriglobia bacterium]